LVASILLTVLFYLYFFLDAGILLFSRNSIQPITVPIVANDSTTIINNYTLLTTDISQFIGLSFTTAQVRDDMNCVRQLYYNPNQGGNVLLLDQYFRSLPFIGVICIGYIIAFSHFFLMYFQYHGMDLSRIMTTVK
jgi:hypothetical protein